MKKYNKLFIFTLVTFLISLTSVFAKEMTVKELGEEVAKLKPDASYVYILGKYAFTSEYEITQNDIVLASTSINPTNPTNPDDMIIYQISRNYNDAYEPLDWKKDKSVLGDAIAPDTFDISYIDYTLYTEPTKATITLDLSNEEKYKTYIEFLKDKNFETSKFYSDNKLTYKDGKVSGILLKNEEIKLTDEEKEKYGNAQYFFAYVLEVPYASEKTKITISGMNTDELKYDDFNVKDGKNSGIVVLVPINIEDYKKDSKYNITVDLDGDTLENGIGAEYEATTYTLDLSELKFQVESEAFLNDNESDISKEDIETLKNWGYTSLGNNKHYTLTGKNRFYNLTGTVEQQYFKAGTFSSSDENGYFFIFNITKPSDLKEIPDSVKVTVKGQQTITYGKESFNDNGVFTEIFKLDENCVDNCKILITVDWDGSQNQYFESQKIVIGYSNLTFVKSSKFEIKNINEAAENKLENDFGWGKVEGFNTKFETKETNVTVTGLIPILEQFKDSKNPFNADDATGYYLPFIIETKVNKNNNTTVKFISDEESKTITSDNFDSEKEIYILKHLHNDATDKTFTIVVDIDGDLEEYTPYSLTVDWNSLTLQENSSTIPSLNSSSDTDKKTLTDWGYKSDFNEIDLVNLEKNTYKLTGKMKEQVLNDKPFGKSEKTGYFFDFTFIKPENVKSGNAKIQSLSDITGTIVKKEFNQNEYDEKGNLTILKRFDPETTCATNKKNCKLYYRIDWDGEGSEYLPTIYTIDYSDVIFEKSSLFKVQTLDKNNDKKFDDNKWLNDDYSTEIIQDENDQTIYHVSGLLPLYGNKDKYNLGLKLNLIKEPEEFNSEEMSIKLLSSDIEDTDNVIKTDSNTIYILKYLDESETTKEFKIILDLDKQGEEYAPYEVTIDYSNLKFQNESVGNIECAIFDDISSDEDLTNWNFNSKSIEELSVETNNKLQGKIKQQTLKDGVFSNSTGYFVPIKISVPINEQWFDEYKTKWTITIYDENGSKKTPYTPNKIEQERGWVVVLFKLDDKKVGLNNALIKYEIDFDGSGKDFLPASYTIDYKDLTFKEARTLNFKGVDANSVTVWEDDTITEDMLPEENPTAVDKYHEFVDWIKEDGTKAIGLKVAENDITLVPHWNLYSDKFITDVIDDLNLSKDEGSKSEDFSKEFKFEKSIDSGDITINIIDPTITLSRINDTSIPGAIAYILLKDEIKSITLEINGETKEFTKTLEDQELLKKSIQDGIKELYAPLLSTNFESKIIDQVTLAALAHKENMNSFTLKINLENVSKTVTLKESDPTAYKFTFKSDVISVGSQSELEEALSGNAKQIFISNDFTVDKSIEINRKVVIDGGAQNHKITANNSSIFTINAVNVNINNLTLESNKEGIIVSKDAELNSTGLKILCDDAGITIISGGKFTGEKLTYDNESYSKPFVKAEQNSTVNLTNINGEISKSVTLKEVKRYVYNEEDAKLKVEIGDELINKENYNYVHYYNDSSKENNFIKITYIADRVITGKPLKFIRWFDKEDPSVIEPPEGIEYLNTYTNNLYKYTVEYWVNNLETYEAGKVPAPDKETYYAVDLRADYVKNTKEVTTEDELKEAVAKNSEFEVVIVKGNIELNSELNIEKPNILILGVGHELGNTYGTITGKINIKAENVKFEKLNIVGKTESPQDKDVITVHNTGFNVYQVNVKADSSNGIWNSLIHFYEGSPTAIVYFSKFDGKNSKIILDFSGEISNNSRIVGNDFSGANETKEFIYIDKIAEGATIDITHQSATFVGDNEYGIRIQAPKDKTNATINLGKFWAGKIESKVLKIAIDVTDEAYDASGFIFQAGSIFENSIQIVYVKDGKATDYNPIDKKCNATLKIGDKVVAGPSIEETAIINGLSLDNNVYSGTLLDQSSDGKFYLPVTLTSNDFIDNVSKVKVTDPNGNTKIYTYGPTSSDGLAKKVDSGTMSLQLEAIKTSNIKENNKKVYDLALFPNGIDSEQSKTYKLDYSEVETIVEKINEAAKNTQEANDLTVTKNNFIKYVYDNSIYQYDKKNHLTYNRVTNSSIEEYNFRIKDVDSDHIGDGFLSLVKKSENYKCPNSVCGPELNGWIFDNKFSDVSMGVHELELLIDSIKDKNVIEAIKSVNKSEENTYTITINKDRFEQWLDFEYINNNENDDKEKETTNDSDLLKLEVRLTDDGYISKIKTLSNFDIKSKLSDDKIMTYTGNRIDVTIENVNKTIIKKPIELLTTDNNPVTIEKFRDTYNKFVKYYEETRHAEIA